MHVYESREALAGALAAGVAAVLAGAIATRGEARLAVSGGSTPALFLEALSQMEIDWAGVTVTLVDERFVAEDSLRSNASLVKRSLLRGKAAAAHFLPMVKDVTAGLAESANEADRAIAMMGTLDAAILGMGNDGHTASFFPGGDMLAEALDAGTHRHVIAIQAPGAGEPRLTLTLRTLLDANFLALHIEGAEKRETLARALGKGPETEMPVRAVLNRAAERMQIFWAP